jgi:chromosome segregation ATPase
MATAMIYDTLKLAEQLEHEAGFDAARAKAMARILAENAGGNLATREDLLVVEAELEAAIQALQFDLGARIAGMDVKIAGLDGKAAGMEGKFASIDGKLASMEGKFASMEGKFASIDGKLASMEGKFASIDGKLASMEGKFASVDGKLTSMGGQIGELRGDIRVLYWMTGTTLAGVAALLGTAITIALHIMHLG